MKTVRREVLGRRSRADAPSRPWHVTLLRSLARLGQSIGIPPRSGERAPLDRSLAFLGSDVTADTLSLAAAVAGILVAVSALLVVLLFGTPLVALCVALAAGIATDRIVLGVPPFLATVRRTRALGQTGTLVASAVLRMRLEPTLERGVDFAARTGSGPLAASLAEHVRRARGTGRSGASAFAAEWKPWFPSLPRAVALLAAVPDAPPGERERTLERALDTVLDTTRDQLAGFAGEIRAPATGLYAFGVLLPLALVGMLPAARVAGLDVGLLHVVLLYDLLLPVGLVIASAWILGKRPVAFPPPAVGRSHPDVPSGHRRSCFAALCGIAIGAVGSWLWLPPWTVPIACVGFGTGAFLVVATRPVKRVRDRVRAIESGLDDALFLIGNRIADGDAVESALAHAGRTLPGETGRALADGVGVNDRLRVGVYDAFLGDYGALADVPSQRARGAVALLALAAREGRPAGDAVVAMATHLSDLRTIEGEARRELRQVTQTLANTAALFGPLVAGATVALADGLGRAAERGGTAAGELAGPTTGLSGTAPPGGQTIATSDLGLAVGLYALLLAAILTGLAVVLEHGLDRALVGYRIGFALLAATATFLVAFLGAGLLL